MVHYNMSSMEKIISIILPIFNGEKYLSYTLSLIEDQIKRNIDLVDFIICDNGSIDNTLMILKDIWEDDPYFKIVSYNDSVPIGNSIYRSVSNATTKYIYLWGDDDIPGPFMIDSLLYYIRKYPQSGVFHFNFIEGKERNLDNLGPIRVNNVNYDQEVKEYTDIDQYIANYYLSMGFLSSLLFLREVWDRGCDYDNSKHYGYQFLYPLFYGLHEYTAVYISFPLCLKRFPMNRQWISEAVYYRFIGLPNLLYDLENNEIIKNASLIWFKVANTNDAFFKMMPQACLDKPFYNSKIKEIYKYQNSVFRKIMVWAFINLMPENLYKLIRKIIYKQN
jgi:glycosyltransferase involved in cell wall biosynthesis